MNEALAFGKPMAIMPFMADQMMVAVVHRDLGVAVLVNKNEATPQNPGWRPSLLVWRPSLLGEVSFFYIYCFELLLRTLLGAGHRYERSDRTLRTGRHLAVNEATPQSLTESIRQIASEAYQRRSAQIRKLNEERKDMSRAVEVIVNQATGAFRLHVPPCPHILIRCIPLFLTLLIWGACCNCCGCLHVRPQIPCACCRSGKSSEKANGRTKQD